MAEPSALRDLGAKARRVWDFVYGIGSYAVVKWSFRLGRQAAPLKLHLGCGDRHLEGYVNIDRRSTPATDVVCGVTKLPYPTGSAQAIETYHVIEHLPRHELPTTLREWHRVLAPGGTLVIECPDFDAAAREYLAGCTERLDSIFGLQRFPGDAHLFGYNVPRLQRLLQSAGFVDVRQAPARDYHASSEPCLRVECVKGPA